MIVLKIHGKDLVPVLYVILNLDEGSPISITFIVAFIYFPLFIFDSKSVNSEMSFSIKMLVIF